MSKFTDIITETTTSLIGQDGKVLNSATAKRSKSTAHVSKLSITNYSTHASGATVKIWLDGVRATRTVNQVDASVTKIIFDQENYVSATDRLEVGDTVYDSVGDHIHGTVKHLNPDKNNTKEITISSSTSVTDGETFTIGKVDNYITGIVDIPAGVTLVLDDPFSFSLYDYELKITNTGTSPGLTVRID